MVYLFVYGTLLSSIKHPMHQLLVKDASFLGNGYFQGRLFDLEHYPGAIESSDPEDQVRGETYLLHNLSVLKELDDYEQFYENNISSSLFVRKRLTIVQENGHILSATIYLYNSDVCHVNRIHSGDFYSYKQHSSTSIAN